MVRLTDHPDITKAVYCGCKATTQHIATQHSNKSLQYMYILLLTAACEAGRFLDVNTNTCQQCPIGTYQDKIWQNNCTSCGDAENWRTDQTGSADPTDCKCKLYPYHIYLRNEFHVSEVYRSINYIGLHAKLVNSKEVHVNFPGNPV